MEVPPSMDKNVLEEGEQEQGEEAEQSRSAEIFNRTGQL